MYRNLPLSLSALAALGAISPSAFAAGEPATPLQTMVVSATREETPLRQVGSSMTVITAEDIAHRGQNNVADVLRGVPGVDVVRSGGVGQTTSVFLRGADSRHTLVLIDGVEMNDPSNPGGLFDFAALQTDRIERIEILRGGESSLYGSDAIGGVIHIITKKGRGPLKFDLSGQGGSYDSFRFNGGVAGGDESLHYALDASRTETGGFSTADRRRGSRERDGYANTTVSGRLGAKLLENLDLDWTLRYNQFDTQLDNCGGPALPCDDPNYRTQADQLFTRGQGRLQLLDGLWEQKLGLAYSMGDRRNVNREDVAHPMETLHSAYQGEKIKLDWQNNLYLHETNTFSFGIENEEDRIHAEDHSTSAFGPYDSVLPLRTANTSGYYALDRIDLFERSHTTAAVRYDDHNRYGGKVTWRVTQAFSIDETGTRLKGNYGTGFKAPTLYQLYAPGTIYGAIGNPDLAAETSHGWDAGVEQDLFGDVLQVGASWFHNDFRNLIDYLGAAGYQNVAKARSEGVESFLEIRPMDGLSLRGNYTYTRAEDEKTGFALIRRPRHKGSFDANYRIVPGANLNLNILLVGARDDLDFSSYPTARVNLTGYALVNLAGSYDITEHVQIFARVDNLFDKRYEEVLGYGVAGVSGFGGVKVTY